MGGQGSKPLERVTYVCRQGIFCHIIDIRADSTRQLSTRQYITLRGGPETPFPSSYCSLHAEWATGLASAVEFGFYGVERINAALKLAKLPAYETFADHPFSFMASLAVLLDQPVPCFDGSTFIRVNPVLGYLPGVRRSALLQEIQGERLEDVNASPPPLPGYEVALYRALNRALRSRSCGEDFALLLASVTIDSSEDIPSMEVKVADLGGLNPDSAFFQWIKGLRDYFFGAIV